MGSSPTIGRHMQCQTAQKNINSFLRETLKGNELRRTYYHLVKCPDCKEILLDEFSFYTVFNDLDSDLNFSYNNKLKELMKRTEDKIVNGDKKKVRKYILASIMICIIFVALLIVALKVMYR